MPKQSATSTVAVAAASERKAVLLAQTTDDLYDERERVRACLDQYGMKVLPENDYPQGGPDFAAAFETDIARRPRCSCSSSAISAHASRRTRRRRTRSFSTKRRKARGLKILQWRRPDLDLAAVTHRDKPLLEGPEVLAVGLEEFKGEILRFHAQLAKPVAGCR